MGLMGVQDNDQGSLGSKKDSFPQVLTKPVYIINSFQILERSHETSKTH